MTQRARLDSPRRLLQAAGASLFKSVSYVPGDPDFLQVFPREGAFDEAHAAAELARWFQVLAGRFQILALRAVTIEALWAGPKRRAAADPKAALAAAAAFAAFEKELFMRLPDGALDALFGGDILILELFRRTGVLPRREWIGVRVSMQAADLGAFPAGASTKFIEEASEALRSWAGALQTWLAGMQVVALQFDAPASMHARARAFRLRGVTGDRL